jgi:phosphoglycolate phosphatase (TIGR01487 family)
VLKALLTDIDGTLTDGTRRINTDAIRLIRSLVDNGILVVLASGNTSCSLEALCRMIGTQGAFIAENGGAYRTGYSGKLRIKGDQAICKTALEILQDHYRSRGSELTLLSPEYRYADLAFARTVPVEEVKDLLRDVPVQVLDTGFAIHLQSPGVNKGTTFLDFAEEYGLDPKEVLAIGDCINDTQMIKNAGIGITVANGHPETKAAAAYVAEKIYGDGFVEGITRYYSYFLAR